MDSNNIKILLNKYWEGDSSLLEEAKLRAYFKRADIAEDLKPYQPLFQFFHSEHEKYLNEDFDQKLIQNLQSADKPVSKVRRLPYYLMRVAAACLLLLSVYFVINQNFSKPDDSIADHEVLSPEDAYAQTKAALLLVSSKLKKGTDKANEGMAQINKATGVIK